MNYIFGMLIGYIIHDAVQPTAVGQVLDKISLPSDLLSKENSSKEAPAG